MTDRYPPDGTAGPAPGGAASWLGIRRSALVTKAAGDVTKPRTGRPPIGDRPQTPAERKRRERARKRAAAAAARPGPLERPGTLTEWVATLTVTQGEHVGQPLTVQPWQEDYLRRVEALAGGELGLSVASGAGKSTLAATIAAAAVAGPLARPRADVLCAAGSFGQARIVFGHVRAFLRPMIERQPDRWRVLDSEHSAGIEDRENGASLRCREASARTLQGSAAALIVADEPAAWQRTQAEAIYSALRSRLGKIPDGRLIAIGTRPEDPEHWFTALCERSGIVYAAAQGADPFLPETWAAANPSLPHLPALRRVYEREAEESRHDPALLRMFRGFRLNQPVRLDAPDLLLDPDVWRGIEGTAPARGPAVIGIDLGGGLAMSAAAAFFPESGRLDAFATLPAVPDLDDRGRSDGVGSTYREMSDRGELITTPGRAPDVPALVRHALQRWGTPAAIVADRYRERELRDALDAAGLSAVPAVLRGQGYVDGAADVREFRQACVRGDVTPVPGSLLLRFAMSGSVTVTDQAGNAKLAKSGEGNRRQRHRDDAAAAAILAVAEGSRRSRHRHRRTWRAAGIA